ncbi:MAG: hypothetical protein U0992_18350 [Planctomycetaceae bacterium]
MGRPVTLFTGQWADLPLDTLCKKAKDFGYDGPAGVLGRSLLKSPRPSQTTPTARS